MRRFQSSPATLATSALLTALLCACSAAPDGAETAGSTTSPLLIKNPNPPPVFLQSGVDAQWLEPPSGGPMTTMVLHFYQAQGTVTHDVGGMKVTLWADLDGIGVVDSCEYEITVSPKDPGVGSRFHFHTGGPLLCDGTPFSLDAVVEAYGIPPARDLVTAAFENSVGDTLQNVCTATNGAGVTIPTTFTLYVNGYGRTAAGANADYSLTPPNGQASVINVQLECD